MCTDGQKIRRIKNKTSETAAEVLIRTRLIHQLTCFNYLKLKITA